jgi:hypothetical protein
MHAGFELGGHPPAGKLPDLMFQKGTGLETGAPSTASLTGVLSQLNSGYVFWNQMPV